jgi:[1-hydroxy-2-(trimethylamino)ethyl]phosphonate dioxygenase
MKPDAMLDRLERLFAARGAEEYHGEAVSQLEHALQTAAAGQRDKASPELIVAALLHDIGHLLQSHGENAAERGIDDRHEALGQRFLQHHFGPAVTAPVRLHVAAKRYLCAVEPDYLTLLSPASRRSLELQGGPMSVLEVAAFEREEHFRPATQLRRWDDKAKVPGLLTPGLESYRGPIQHAFRCNG